MMTEKPKQAGDLPLSERRHTIEPAQSGSVADTEAAIIQLDAQLLIQPRQCPQALSEIAQISGVSLAGGRLTVDDALALTRIRAFMAEAQQGAFARIVVKSSRRSWPLLIELSRVSQGVEARFIDLEAPIRLDGESLRRAFRLSDAEILTAEFIVNGKRPTEIARKRAVAVSTVRTHIANLFSKTSTNRQPELAVLLSFFKH